MKVKVLLATVLACAIAGYAASSPAKLYSALERHLQTLKSLELSYEAEGTGLGEETVAGRMVWVRPDRFYHDTPAWILCTVKSDQWRYLRAQNTLIREVAAAQERWTPENLLFDLGKSFRPESLTEREDGMRLLKLRSSDPNLAGFVTLEMPQGAAVPNRIRFELADGTATDYRITEWKENVSVDTDVFNPPYVPAENVIDFRPATGSTR